MKCNILKTISIEQFFLHFGVDPATERSNVHSKKIKGDERKLLCGSARIKADQKDAKNMAI